MSDFEIIFISFPYIKQFYLGCGVYISTVAHADFLRFQKFWGVFFMTLEFSPLYFILDASSSGFYEGYAFVRCLGRQKTIFFFLFSPCAWSSSFRDAFFSVHFFLDAPSGISGFFWLLHIRINTFKGLGAEFYHIFSLLFFP